MQSILPRAHWWNNLFESGEHKCRWKHSNVCGLNWQLWRHKHWNTTSITFVNILRNFVQCFISPQRTLSTTSCLFAPHWLEHMNVTSCSYRLCYFCQGKIWNLKLECQDTPEKSWSLGPCCPTGSATYARAIGHHQTSARRTPLGWGGRPKLWQQKALKRKNCLWLE